MPTLNETIEYDQTIDARFSKYTGRLLVQRKDLKGRQVRILVLTEKKESA